MQTGTEGICLVDEERDITFRGHLRLRDTLIYRRDGIEVSDPLMKLSEVI